MSKPRPKLLSDWVKEPVTEIIKFWQQEVEESEPKEIGQGFEVPLGSIWVEPDTKKSHQWEERWLVVKSNALAQRQIKGLHTRLQKGEKALATLAQRPGNEQQVLQRKVEDILKSNRLSKYMEYSISKKISYDKVYLGLGPRSQSSSYKRRRKTTLQLNYKRMKAEIEETEMLAGWRLYVTNATPERLTLTEAVESYKEQWQPEQGFHRFKKGRLSALPIYFRDEGLYDGNPKRSTKRPTAEKLLKAFCNITLYKHRDGSQEISGLNMLQKQILNLMKVPEYIYTNLAPDSG